MFLQVADPDPDPEPLLPLPPLHRVLHQGVQAAPSLQVLMLNNQKVIFLHRYLFINFPLHFHIKSFASKLTLYH